MIAAVTGGLGDLVGDSTTLAAVVVTSLLLVRAYQYLQRDQRADAAEFADRVDRQRTNVHTLVAYIAIIARLIPPDVDVPQFPELLPEVDPEHPRPRRRTDDAR